MSLRRWLNRVFLLGVCALGLASIRPALAEEAPLEEKDLRKLAQASRHLAGARQGDLATELLDVAAALGYPEGKVGKLRKECEGLAKRAPARSAARKQALAVKAIREEVEKLAVKLTGLAEENRTRTAQLLLALDHECESAHLALGHELISGTWMTPEQKTLIPRRRGFQEVLQKARTYPVEVTIGGSPDAVILAVTGQSGHRVVSGSVELHGTQAPARLTRMLRESIRASLVANWLLTGELGVPENTDFTRYRAILFPTKEQYHQALDEELRLKHITEKQRDHFRDSPGSHTYSQKRLRQIHHARTEAYLEAELFRTLVDYTFYPSLPSLLDTQASLQAALSNLVCLAYLGCPAVPVQWQSRDGSHARRSATESQKNKVLYHYPAAGLAGNRRYVGWLAREQMDPPWMRTFRDQNGKIVGDERIKTTSVLEFLAEHGPLCPLFVATRPPLDEGRELARVLEESLGESLDSLEKRWRAWLLPDREMSLLRRLKGGHDTDARLAPSIEKGLVHLNAQRARSGLDAVRFDSGLAEDAKRHAEYLSKNPEQLDAWPDAHEEYPDKPGFSPGGCWAGLHSVISPGDDPVTEAIDGWLGTYYHRLSLLSPGLLAVGWGSSERAVVLDSKSLSMNIWYEAEVSWPFDGMRNVPTTFRPELPNPLPGEDQSQWGYPVTLQVWNEDGGEVAGVTMTLHKGKRDGPTVPSHFSTPGKPTNPEHAPSNAYCLIPKSHLSPSTTYVVVAQILEPAKTIVWEFTTGR